MDPIGNAFHTALTADIPGSTVLVIGCGPIGCFAVGVARAAGAARVFAADLITRRLELAKQMGAHVCIDVTQEDPVQRVMGETHSEGVDVVCEMSGHPDAIRQALKCARPGGRVQLLGIPKKEVSIQIANDLIFKGLTVYGVVGRKMFETWYQMQSFLGSGLFDPSPVVTHTFPMQQIDDALAAIRSGEAGKVILEIGGSALTPPWNSGCETNSTNFNRMASTRNSTTSIRLKRPVSPWKGEGRSSSCRATTTSA